MKVPFLSYSHLEQVSVQDLQTAAGAQVLPGWRHRAGGGGWRAGGGGRSAGRRAGLLPLHVGPLGFSFRVRLQKAHQHSSANTQNKLLQGCAIRAWRCRHFYLLIDAFELHPLTPTTWLRAGQASSCVACAFGHCLIEELPNAQTGTAALTVGARVDGTLRRRWSDQRLNHFPSLFFKRRTVRWHSQRSHRAAPGLYIKWPRQKNTRGLV